MMREESTNTPDIKKVALDLAVQYLPDAAKQVGGIIARKYGGVLGGLAFDAVADIAINELQKRYANA